MKSIYSAGTLLITALGAWIALMAGFVVAAEAQEQVAIPDTPAAIWQSIDDQINTLDSLLTSGELERVHYHAFAVRDLVGALVNHSQDLDPEDVKQVEAYVGYVATLATRLDQTGDSNDHAGTTVNLEQLKRLLVPIRSHYPSAMQ